MTVVQSERSRFRKKGDFEQADFDDAANIFAQGEAAVLSGEYDLVIFDEINFAAFNKLVKIEDILEMLEKRPPHVTVVLTGRYADEAVMEAADLVSEVREIKHHFHKGIAAQPGVEY